MIAFCLLQVSSDSSLQKLCRRIMFFIRLTLTLLKVASDLFLPRHPMSCYLGFGAASHSDLPVRCLYLICMHGRTSEKPGDNCSWPTKRTLSIIQNDILAFYILRNDPLCLGFRVRPGGLGIPIPNQEVVHTNALLLLTTNMKLLPLPIIITQACPPYVIRLPLPPNASRQQ